MRIDVLTLFPEMFESPLSASILKRAREAGVVDIHLTDIRDFSKDKHKKVDVSSTSGRSRLSRAGSFCSARRGSPSTSEKPSSYRKRNA